jgi:proteasome lid subunit RPN8/RPN11
VKEDAGETIALPKELADKLIHVCLEALPGKAYGLVGGKDAYHPASIYPCSTNLRENPEWRSLFESFGEFYKNPDRGFVISPEEHRDILKRMEARGESFIGVFHSHRFTGPDPSDLDIALHAGPMLFCYIVSVVKPEEPRLKAYRLYQSHYEQMALHIV